MIASLFKTVDLIALGETFHGSHLGAFVDIFSELKILDGIFLECPINYQTSIENYIETSILNKKLKEIIVGSLKEGKRIEEFLKLIAAESRKRKIPVICIDSSKIKFGKYINKFNDGSWFLKGKSRDEDMFENITDVLKDRKEKWLLIGGSQHIKYGLTDKGGLTLGNLLNNKLGSNFYNICLWKVDNLSIKSRFYDCREKVPDNLSELMEKFGYSNYDQNNNRYFDGYIVHS